MNIAIWVAVAVAIFIPIYVRKKAAKKNQNKK